MKRSLLALATMALLSPPAFSAWAPDLYKQMRETLEAESKGASIPAFCFVAGGISYDIEGTPPDSLQRLIDRVMVDIHASRSLHWTAAERNECSKKMLEGYAHSANEAEVTSDDG
ncbi:MAG: hypothetical protein ACRC8D_07275 [Aeromonas sp.]